MFDHQGYRKTTRKPDPLTQKNSDTARDGNRAAHLLRNGVARPRRLRCDMDADEAVAAVRQVVEAMFDGMRHEQQRPSRT